jgi:Tol biopolymer transport system component
MIGQTLSHFKITAKLGEGGMGEVYRAKDKKLGREVAIKVLPEAVASDPERLARFEREARAVAALSHPNILAIYDFGTEDGVTYAVTELLEGATLREVLEGGGVPQRKAVEYARQAANGLAAAHGKGVVHRDLKPENLFVTTEGRIKILDFGLAKLFEAGTGEAPTMAPTVGAETGPGVVLGTVGYMSPEQVRGQPADHRSDIFSLGTVLYETVTGQRAFRRESAVETMSAILNQDPPELENGTERLSSGLERVLRHCLEKNPEERFQSARDLAFALEEVTQTAISGTGVGLEPMPEAPRRRAMSWWAVPAAGVALLLGLAVGYLAFRETATAPPQFQRLTFRRGLVMTSRFAADEQTVVYGASWEGGAPEVFTTQLGTPGSRALGFGAADLLSISSTGEMAISLGRRYTVGWETTGTLARVPLEGGAPREILEGVHEADWGPDGNSLAVARLVEGRYRLEYPIATVLYETDGWVSHLRVNPEGDLVAFMDHPVRGDNVGSVAVVDREGRVLRFPDVSMPQGLAWSPAGDEIWGSSQASLIALDLSGKTRVVFTAAGSIRLEDIASDGRILIAPQSIRREVVGRASGADDEINLSWFDWSTLRAISADGRQVLFEEGNQTSATGYWMYLRGTDGSPPIRLDDGLGLALSPDGKWVLALSDPFGEPRLNLYPTGAGQNRPLEVGNIRPQPWGAFLSDGSGILFAGSQEGAGGRLFLHDLGDALRPVTPEGSQFTYDGNAISSDSRWVVAISPDDELIRYPIDGGEGETIPGAEPRDIPIQWDEEGRHIYVYRLGELPTRVYRLNLESGERTLWRELAPADRAGVFHVDIIFMTRNGEAHAYSYRRMLSDLYLARGL